MKAKQTKQKKLLNLTVKPLPKKKILNTCQAPSNCG